MDVLALDLLRSTPAPGSPGRSPAGDARSRQSHSRSPSRPSGPASDPAPRPGGAGGAAAVRRNGLLAYTGASIVLGLGLLAWTSFVSAPLPAIDPGFPRAPSLVRPHRRPPAVARVRPARLAARPARPGGGSTMTFHLPFVGAAMILGGPTAGAWVAFLSIHRAPRAGVPAVVRHPRQPRVLAIAAVMGGLADPGRRRAPGGRRARDRHPGRGDVPARVVLVAVTTGMGVVTVLLREDISARPSSSILVGQFGRITALEVALVIVLAHRLHGAGLVVAAADRRVRRCWSGTTTRCRRRTRSPGCRPPRASGGAWTPAWAGCGAA